MAKQVHLLTCERRLLGLNLQKPYVFSRYAPVSFGGSRLANRNSLKLLIWRVLSGKVLVAKAVLEWFDFE